MTTRRSSLWSTVLAAVAITLVLDAILFAFQVDNTFAFVVSGVVGGLIATAVQ